MDRVTSVRHKISIFIACVNLKYIFLFIDVAKVNLLNYSLYIAFCRQIYY